MLFFIEPASTITNKSVLQCYTSRDIEGSDEVIYSVL